MLTLTSKGWTATCNSGGAGKWCEDYSKSLEGADVVLVPDNDASGERHLTTVAQELTGKADRIRVLRVPNEIQSRKVKDVSDFFDAGGTAAEFQRLIDNAKEWASPSMAEQSLELGGVSPVEKARQSVFFSSASKSWWVCGASGFVEMDKDLVRKELATLGLETPRNHEPVSEIDQFLVSANKNAVHYSGPLAGHRAGLVEDPRGRILITESCRPLQAVDQPCETLLAWIRGLVGNDEHQFHTLLFWMHLRRKALLTSLWRPGHMLVLAGPPQCGKSFLQNLIVTPLLGGRIAKPYRYMAGQTQFNADLFAAEHLLIEDESPNRDLASRRNLGAQVKSMLFAKVQSCHPKGRTPIHLCPIWSLTLSVNEEPENLMVLPPIDDSLADKIIILKCQKPQPPDYGENDEMKALLQMVSHELPGLAHFLDGLTIPPEYAEPRTGLRHYHNPELIRELDGLSPEAKLDQLITVGLLQNSNEWEGKSIELETALTSPSSPCQHEARRIFYYNTACGVYLAKLAKQMPYRYRKKVVHGDVRWVIWAPKCPPDTTEPL